MRESDNRAYINGDKATMGSICAPEHTTESTIEGELKTKARR